VWNSACGGKALNRQILPESPIKITKKIEFSPQKAGLHGHENGVT
jgi:hypothetical protein